MIALFALLYFFCGFWVAGFVLLAILSFISGFMPGVLLFAVLAYVAYTPFRGKRR